MTTEQFPKRDIAQEKPTKKTMDRTCEHKRYLKGTQRTLILIVEETDGISGTHGENMTLRVYTDVVGRNNKIGSITFRATPM